MTETTQAAAPPVASPTLLGRLRGSAAARDGFYVLAAQGIATLIALGADSFLFRELQKSERGILSAAFGLRTVLLYIADMGMTMATVRIGSSFVAKGMLTEANAVFRRALVFRWLAAIVVGGVVLLLTPTLAKQLLETPTRPNLVYACAAALLGMTTVSWGLDVAQCRRRMKSYFVQYVGEAILRACAIVIVLRVMEVHTEKFSELILWTMAAGVILAAIVSVLVERDAFADAKGFGLSAPVGVSTEMRSFIPFATAATCLGMVGIYVELFLLQHLRTPEETAVFEGARRLASLLPLLTAGFATIMLPRASALETPAQCLGYIRKALIVTAPLAVLISGALALSASFIVPLLWGTKYDASIPLLRWMCLAHALSFVATPVSFVLFPLKRPGILVILNGLALALSIGIGITLVKSHGAMGAVWSMLIVRGVMAVVMAGVLISIARKLKVAKQGSELLAEHQTPPAPPFQGGEN